MTSRKPCINVTTTTYSGKELSPLHFGLSAEGYELDTIMEGYDKLLWITKMKNNRKVWVRYSTPNRMVHEQRANEDYDTSKNDEQENMKPDDKYDQKESEDTPNIPIAVCMPTEKDVMKPVVEEKKLTAYNMFLTYRLQELKKHYTTANVKKSNKEIFNEVVKQWKALDKKSEEYASIMKEAEDYSKMTKS